MGLLEELITLIKDTVEEVSEQQKQKQREASDGAAPPPRVSVEELRQRMLQQRRAAAEAEAARLAAQEAAAAPPPEPPRRHAHHAHGHARAEPKAKHVAQPTSPERLARLLRQPHTVRELFVLKEILDRPLVLRRGRR